MLRGSTVWVAVVFALVGCTPESRVGTAPPDVPSTASSTNSSASASTSSPPGAPAGASAPTGTRTLFVREVRVECEGEGPQKCLQVRSSPGYAWTLHYGSIEGFHYEEGHAYELKIRVETVSHPPADGSTRRYHLVDIVSKTKTP